MNAATHVNKDLNTILKKYAALDMFADCEIVSPESRGSDGDTPFHMAAYDGDIDAVRVMLPWVANIDVEGDIGNSPLHYAVLNNKPDMARFLIRHGADCGKKNDYGDTPRDFMEGKESFQNFAITG